jgi:hypothetical protein
LQRAQAYISRAAVTSMAHTQQIRLIMVPSIAIPVLALRKSCQRRWLEKSNATGVVTEDTMK